MAQTLEDRIRSGQIAAGQRLPPHRELAYKLGVAVGSVARAYSVLANEGLVSGEVGRGTIVQDLGQTQRIGLTLDASRIDMRLVIPPPIEDPELLSALGPKTLNGLARSWQRLSLNNFPETSGQEQHRQAAAQWCTARGVAATPGTSIMTYGSQDAMLATILGLTKPSEPILCEEFTAAALRNLATTLGRKLIPVEMDDQGVIPEALADAAKRYAARLIIVFPSLQTPTARRMSSARRAAIAAVVEEAELLLFENSGYGALVDLPADDFSRYLPERCISVQALSNVTLPGLRCATLHAPPRLLPRIVAVLHSVSIALSTVVAEIASTWILSGLAERVLAANRAVLRRRHAIIAEYFPDVALRTPLGSPYIWLPYPDGTADDLVQAASVRGVGVIPSDRFSVASMSKVNAIRVAISTPPNDELVSRGLDILRELVGHD
ncbi:PLP-dependent aminotransferase family protein [Alcaligenaceae bacterium CGII-47]|nr:PLP-dependent aminotransferase family protein [Alcaligenaceae bacterium CGII-47]